ncbi:hypothetical protein ABIB35_001487 [Arthrobacter sp. UYP6]|uniref:hypothetical protein n=1 Tax=Arthrobacter sp. UYP6 TaxID=1756378 RepID=UPI003391D3BF
MATESIILDGQPLSGEDRYGVWTTSVLDGWWYSPEPKGSTEERENADGDYDLPVYYGARYVTIGGSIRTKGHAQQHQAINRFVGLLRNKGRLQVSGHGPTQWADVKRASGFKMEPITDTYAQWQARVKAPDPLKFGDANVFTISPNQTVPLFHYGNAEASPIFDITGNMPAGYTLWGPGGKTFVSPSVVSSTYPHHLDMSEGLLKVNGYYWTGQTGNADLWTIPPGQQVLTGLTTTGTGTAKVTVYDTYI